MTPERFEEGLTWEAFLSRSRTNTERFASRYGEAKPDPALLEKAKTLLGRFHIAVLAEDWCGDVVRNLPVLARLFADHPRVHLRIFWASENKDIWQRHLTDGGWSIPKLIVYDGDFVERGSWGPRPLECQRILTENRSALPMSEIYGRIRDWYESNEDRDLVEEVVSLLMDQDGSPPPESGEPA